MISHIKRYIKKIAAEFIKTTGTVKLSAWSKETASFSIPILTYHRILPKPIIEQVYSSPDIIVSSQSFEKQMQFIAETCNAISLKSYIVSVKNQLTLPKRTVIITFDDGWKDNFNYAFPILKRLKIPATIFLTTGYIEQKDIFWQEQIRYLLHIIKDNKQTKLELKNYLIKFKNDLPELSKISSLNIIDDENIITILKSIDQKLHNNFINELMKILNYPQLPYHMHDFLDWNDIRIMKNHGLEFGSHTVNHLLLDKTDKDTLWNELKKSKEQIEMRIGEEVYALAYPNGNFNNDVIEAAQKTGYLCAVTTIEGNNTTHCDLMRLKRINISEKRFSGPNGQFSESIFECYLAGML
jgi:peptidoglycan/xylan/chitin deacetylase (PgdA/CDA1 family)